MNDLSDRIIRAHDKGRLIEAGFTWKQINMDRRGGRVRRAVFAIIALIAGLTLMIGPQKQDLRGPWGIGLGLTAIAIVGLFSAFGRTRSLYDRRAMVFRRDGGVLTGAGRRDPALKPASFTVGEIASIEKAKTVANNGGHARLDGNGPFLFNVNIYLEDGRTIGAAWNLLEEREAHLISIQLQKALQEIQVSAILADDDEPPDHSGRVRRMSEDYR